VPQGFILAQVLYSLYINDATATHGIYLALFAYDTCIYATEKHESRVFNKFQRALAAVVSWCQRWNINEGKALAIYFPRRRRLPEDNLQLNDRKISFVKNIKYKYLGIIFDRRTTWILHIETTAATALGTYIKIFSLLQSNHLNVDFKLIVYRALIRSIMTYACPTWEFAADTYLMKLQRLQNRVLRTIGNRDRCTPVRDLHLTLKTTYV
jgi:hypothetical protein